MRAHLQLHLPLTVRKTFEIQNNMIAMGNDLVTLQTRSASCQLWPRSGAASLAIDTARWKLTPRS